MTTTYQSSGVTQLANPSGAPFGNLYDFKANLTLNASGVLVPGTTADSGASAIIVPATGLNASAAMGNGDTVNLCILPAGTVLKDAIMTVSTAFVASTTFNIGFAAVGTDTNSINNATFFASALSGTSAVTSRKVTAAAPIKLPYDCYLTVTAAAGLGSAAAGVLDIDVIGVVTGGTGL